MPIVGELEEALYVLAPGEGAMDWDNVGLLVGDRSASVERVLVALDITEEVVSEALARGCQAIAAHHPVMNCKWQQVQTLLEDTPQGHLLRRLIQNNLAAICMHTNLDAAWGGVNDVLARALEVAEPEPFNEENVGRCGYLSYGPVPLQDFVRNVCGALHCNGVRYADAGREVNRVAVGGGACGEFLDAAIAAGCDTYVTADLSYHQFLDARPKGLNLIDAGHFPTEDVICPVLVDFLRERFPEIGVEKAVSHREVIQYFTPQSLQSM